MVSHRKLFDDAYHLSLIKRILSLLMTVFLFRRQLTVMKALAMDADDILNQDANLVTLKVYIPDLLLQVSSTQDDLFNYWLILFYFNHI